MSQLDEFREEGKLALLATRAKLHVDPYTRALAVDQIVASHVALSRQLERVRVTLDETANQARALGLERDRLTNQLATVRENLATVLDERNRARALLAEVNLVIDWDEVDGCHDYGERIAAELA
jgi:predicted  nucleic acid-binding Zn-ribbon protein